MAGGMGGTGSIMETKADAVPPVLGLTIQLGTDSDQIITQIRVHL